jgi:dihydrolipoamide dehydrogenase
MPADEPVSTQMLVIGAGPGGYVAAIRAAQLGVDVMLVEKDTYGGVCLNHGCIPSKALVTAADLVHRSRTADHLGIDATVSVNAERLVAWKDRIVDQLTSGVESLCRTNGIELVEGCAYFESDRLAHIDGDDRPDQVKFENTVIATGSQPITISGFEPDGEIILTSQDILSIQSLPDSLLVIGGGYIGMELSTALAKLDVEVTVIEMLDDILPNYEKDVTTAVHERAKDLGVSIHTGEAADSWERNGDGLVIETKSEDSISTFTADRALVAVGRTPMTDTLNIQAAGVRTDAGGFIKTTESGQTNSENIFAIGDVAGEPMLAHKASKEGEIVAEVIAGEPSALDFRAIPAAVFTDPEIGTVGLTEREANEEGFDPIVGKMPLRANGRALTHEETDGFVRIVADAETEFVLGAQIVGPDASELLAEVALAIEVGATLEDVIATIHTHPTLSEAVMESAANVRGEAIHTSNH